MSLGGAIPGAAGRLRVLCLEDDPQDAELSVLALRQAGYEVEAEVVAERGRFLERVQRGDLDLVLLDYSLRGWTGLDALRELRSRGSDLPVIVVSGTLGDDTAVECVKQGACDYVLKHRLVRLPIAVQRTLRTRALQREHEAAEREREQLHRQMAERERKYRELFELANEAILIFEPQDEVILEANPCACATYGYDRHELVGMSLKRLTRDVEQGERQIERLLAAGHYQNFETVHVRRDGAQLWMLASGKVIDYAGRPAVLTVNRDISELKQAEAKLRQAHADLEQRVEERTAELARVNAELTRARDEWQSTFDCMSDAITVHDPSYSIMRWNRAFREMFPEAELGAKCYRLVHGTEQPPENCPMARTLVSARSEQCDMFEPHLNRYISVRTDPIYGLDGGLAGIVHAVTDISERKEIERMKSDFVAMVSHELRTPLTSLRGFVELMLRREYPRAQRQQFLEVILRESQRLGELVNDVLDLQRIESGHQVFRLEPVSVAELVQQVADVFSGASEGHPISIDVPADIPLVFADAERMRQVMGNLVSNALKYSPEGGAVRIGARSDPGEVVAWVSDEGIGIPHELHAKIFSRFYRVDNSATRKVGGTGLGLSLVKDIKDIVEAHGGRVWVESVPGQGSTFYFTMKVAEADESSTRGPELRTGSSSEFGF